MCVSYSVCSVAILPECVTPAERFDRGFLSVALLFGDRCDRILMPAWELSDSDSSTSSSSPPPEVPRRKRGRPRKQRSDDHSDASAHAVVPAVAEASAHAVAPVGIEELVRPVGGGVFSLVGKS